MLKWEEVNVKVIFEKRGAQKLPAHDGHRDRLRKKFLINDVDSFEDHEILELLLFYAIPRKNTNETAHNLLENFGSISAIFDAPISRLKKIKGMGENSAIFIKLISALSRLYYERKYNYQDTALSVDQICDNLVTKFIGRNEEAVTIVLLDAKSKVIFDGVINKGSVNSVDLYIRKMIELLTIYIQPKKFAVFLPVCKLLFWIT